MVMVDFKALHLMLVVLLKSASIAAKDIISPIDPFSRMITSSTKSIWVRVHSSVILIPCSRPDCFSFMISRLSASIMRRKRRGERGQP